MARQKKQQNTKRIPPNKQKKIVTNYDIIAMETLNISGMLKNKRWASKLQKISLHKLVKMLKYKAEWHGKTFIQIDRFYPSTKTCHICEYQKKNLTLNIRQWTCPSCGTHHQRDINAAINILNEAMKLNS